MWQAEFDHRLKVRVLSNQQQGRGAQRRPGNRLFRACTKGYRAFGPAALLPDRATAELDPIYLANSQPIRGRDKVLAPVL